MARQAGRLAPPAPAGRGAPAAGPVRHLGAEALDRPVDGRVAVLYLL